MSYEPPVSDADRAREPGQPSALRPAYTAGYPPPIVAKDRYWLHIGLFILTFVATVYAGQVLVGRTLLYERGGPLTAVLDGLRYAIPLLFFLTVHEFGHYFAARFHRVSTTLPYYIPSPFIFIPFNIGTFGAVIRIREPVPSTRKLFDIGVAGPLAGFVAALGILIYALATLPAPSYIFDLPGHMDVKALVREGVPLPEASPIAGAEYIGQTILYWALSQFFENVPPMYEMYHYPVLFAAWLSLFFTALNLMPIGQLDGGHILYALVGPKWHGRLARGFVLLLVLSAAIGFSKDIGALLHYYYGQWGLLLTWLSMTGIVLFFMRRIFAGNGSLILIGLVTILGLVLVAEWMGPQVTQYGYLGWMLWCVLIVVFIRIDHPPVLYAEPLTPKRRALGILSLMIFVLCFSIRPIYAGSVPPDAGTPPTRSIAVHATTHTDR